MPPDANLGLFGWNEALWVSVGAIVSTAVVIVSGLMALFTRSLAIETKTLAKETRDLATSAADERAQAERHHQQSLMPLVFAEGGCKLDRLQEGFQITFNGTLRNIGAGPSPGVNMLLRPEGFVGRTKYLGVLGAGQQNHFIFRWTISDVATPQKLLPYHSLVRFQTIFGTEGAVHQHSHSGNAEDALVVDLVLPDEGRAAQHIKDVIQTYFPGENPAL